MTVTNSTLTGNSAQYGGALYNKATLTVSSSTLSGNSAQYDGGGIYNTGDTLTVMSTIVAGNQDSNGQDIYGWTDPGGNHNLIGGNPLLAPLAWYGGPNQTMALLPGSPAIDSGAPNGPVTDQRGVRRVGTPDIGAFESQGFTITAISGNNQSTALTSAFPQPLVVTVSSAYGEPVVGGQVALTAPASGASASMTSTPATIGTDGTASVTATANAIPGSYRVSASARGAASIGFRLTNTQLSYVVQPVGTQAGSQFMVQVWVQDTLGNSVIGTRVTLALAANPAGGTLHGILTQTTDSNGQATFNDLWLGKAGSGYRLSASCNGHTATSAAFTITPGTASTIAFTTQPPANTSAGAAFTTVVRVQDEYGNNVSGVSVTLALGANPTGGTLHGTLTRITAKTGLASFTNLWVDRAGKRYSVTAAVATVGIVATSRSLNITPSPVGLVATANPTFTWYSVAGADHYSLYVMDMTTHRTLVQLPSVTSTFWALPKTQALRRGHSYYWNVGAYDKNGRLLAWSPPYIFRY
jgi:hypothetical protein